MAVIGRDQPCPCGSGEKYKKCFYGKNDKGFPGLLIKQTKI
jgi:hypothetical protein